MIYREDKDQTITQKEINIVSSILIIFLSFWICLFIGFIFWIKDFIFILFS